MKKSLLFALVATLCSGCYKNTSNDDHLQAHEQKALDILEHYMESHKESTE